MQYIKNIICNFGWNFIKKQHDDGETSLHYSVKYGKPEITKLLLDNGANPFIKNKDGNTPLDLIKDLEIKKILNNT